MTNSYLRARWPSGPRGAVAYFIDHVILRFEQPVDWHVARAAEETGHGHHHWHPVDVASLSAFEIDLLKLVAKGFTVAQIAESMGMTTMNAAESVNELKAKLGIHLQCDIANLATKHGLI